MEPKYKTCTKCKKEFPATTEFFYKTKNVKCGLISRCKSCHKEQTTIYRKSDRGRMIHNLASRNYRQTENGKEVTREYQQTEKYKNHYKSWQQTDRGKEIQKMDTHRYLQTEKGKRWINRTNNKRRNLGYIELIPNPFSETEEIVWHHFLGAYVIALPKDIHQLYSGYNREKHRDLCINVIKQLYPLDDI